MALDRQGTQQQRPESPTITLTWHASKFKIINSTKGSSKKDAPQWHKNYMLSISSTLGDTGVYKRKTRWLILHKRSWPHSVSGGTSIVKQCLTQIIACQPVNS